LLEAEIHKAEALLAVTNDDNVNITVSLIAKQIHNVPRIIARVNEPGKSYIYETMGIETINPVQSGIEVLKSKLLTEKFDIISALDNNYEIVELLVNKTVSVSVEAIEAECTCIIHGVSRKDSIILPEKEDKISNGDRIICTIEKNDKKHLITWLSKEVFI